MKSFDRIADRTLWLFDTLDGSYVELSIEIGRPEWTVVDAEDAEAVCSVYIRGLMPNPMRVFGSDLLNALECGLRFVQAELKNVPKDNSVRWPGGEPYFD